MRMKKIARNPHEISPHRRLAVGNEGRAGGRGRDERIKTAVRIVRLARD